MRAQSQGLALDREERKRSPLHSYQQRLLDLAYTAINRKFCSSRKAAFVARKKSVAARRPSGMSLVSVSQTSSDVPVNIAVSVGPGLTTLTRMPLGANSFAQLPRGLSRKPSRGLKGSVVRDDSSDATFQRRLIQDAFHRRAARAFSSGLSVATIREVSLTFCRAIAVERFADALLQGFSSSWFDAAKTSSMPIMSDVQIKNQRGSDLHRLHCSGS